MIILFTMLKKISENEDYVKCGWAAVGNLNDVERRRSKFELERRLKATFKFPTASHNAFSGPST